MTDAELLAAARRYREACFADHMMQMRRDRDYERVRRLSDEAAEEAWEIENDKTMDERCRIHYAVEEARLALLEDPPEDYSQLVREMQEEFGDD